MAALIAHDHRRLFGEIVGELALALVAPLGADHYCTGHESLHATLFGVTLEKWYSTLVVRCPGMETTAQRPQGAERGVDQ